MNQQTRAEEVQKTSEILVNNAQEFRRYANNLSQAQHPDEFMSIQDDWGLEMGARALCIYLNLNKVDEDGVQYASKEAVIKAHDAVAYFLKIFEERGMQLMSHKDASQKDVDWFLDLWSELQKVLAEVS